MTTNNTALLVMDVQNGIVGRYGDSPDVVAPFQKAVAAARDAGVPVIFVRVAFRDGYAEISPRNKMFSAIASHGGMALSEHSTQIHESVTPLADEPLVTKKRVSAFAGSDLEVVLRAHNIEHLVLTGIATSGVVLSTLREAADKDYGLTVLKDACLDGDPEVHRVLTEKVFPRQAEVISVDEWVNRLK